MSETSTFRIATPPFAHQDIDGEIVIVNVETGVYYSLRGTGAAIFGRLSVGASVGETVAFLAARYAADAVELTAHVERLAAELVADGIFAESERPDAVAAPAFAGEPAPFVAPLLERFTDMKDLLLLDPIHEVSDDGWPIVKTPGA